MTNETCARSRVHAVLVGPVSVVVRQSHQEKRQRRTGKSLLNLGCRCPEQKATMAAAWLGTQLETGTVLHLPRADKAAAFF